MKTFFSAQSGLISPDKAKEWHIILIGCGGLGSYIGPAVSKLGIGRLDLIDFDRVEIDNIAGQNFLEKDIGRAKVEIVANNSIGRVYTHQLRVKESGQLSYLKHSTNLKKIIIPAVDNMATRILAYNAFNYDLVDHNTRYIIDPRMGGEIGKVECCDLLDMDSRKRYVSTLFPDSEGMALPCAERLTGYNAMLISSIVTYMVKEAISVDPTLNNTLHWYNNMPNNAFSLTKY